MTFWQVFFVDLPPKHLVTVANTRFIVGIPDPKKMFHDPGGARNSAVESPVSWFNFEIYLASPVWGFLNFQRKLGGGNSNGLPWGRMMIQFDGVEVAWLVWHPVGLVGRCTQRNCHRTVWRESWCWDVKC